LKNYVINGASSLLATTLINDLIFSEVSLHCQCFTSNAYFNDLSSRSNNLFLYYSDFNDVNSTNTYISKLKSLTKIDAIIHFNSCPFNLLPFHKIEWDDYSSLINIQCRSLFLLIKKLHKTFSKPFKIIIINSEVSLLDTPPSGFSAYTATKYFLSGIAKSLHSDYFKHGYLVNQISPAMFNSPLLERLPSYLVNSLTSESGSKSTVLSIKNKILELLSKSGDHIYNKNFHIL
jgi:NAD(P)-dependent dehydrogenase (short-subunit alcohol dehydrogenase family)